MLYYIVFEVIFNIWKNKIETEENMFTYYTADFASRFFPCFSPSVVADLPSGIVNSVEQGQCPPIHYHARFWG